jgi:hypothetical protein
VGDRGNIVITDSNWNPTIYFYTHWSGSDLPAIVKEALVKGRERWDDTPYLNRVLFQHLLNGDKSLAGFGIDTQMGDGGTEVYINHDLQQVRYEDTDLGFAEYIK